VCERAEKENSRWKREKLLENTHAVGFWLLIKMGYCLHISSELVPGLKQRSSVETNEKVRGYP